MKNKLLLIITAFVFLIGIFGCKGSSQEIADNAIDTTDAFEIDATDLQQSDTQKDITEIHDEGIAEEEILPPECTEDSDCKDKFKDIGQCQVAKCNVDIGKCEKADRPDGSVCDDNNQCTEDEQCLSGKCTNGHNVCQCNNDNDCVQFEDGNLCNGTLICDLSNYPHVCKVDPATVITCDDSKDTFCQANTCDPKTGICQLGPVHEGEACSINGVCAIAAICKNGECIATETKNCNDSNPCTDDSCDPEYGCIHKWNTEDCDDGNACTVSDKCSNGVCVGQPKECDNGKFCDGEETCDPENGCVQGTPPACEDDNACTQDYCDPVLDKCVNPPLADKVEGPMGDPSCSDSIDNDCDGKTDDKDPDCALSFVGIDPVNGPVEGGSMVTLSGTGLSIVTQVLLGGQAVDFQIIDDQTIQFTTPPHDAGAVDLEFGDGWAMVLEEGVFSYVNIAVLPNIRVDVAAADETPIAKTAPFPTLSGTLTIKTRSALPEDMVVQFGWGKLGTKPWLDPSWVWTNATVTVASEGVYNIESSMGNAPAGIFNLAVRVSMDNGASFAYGGQGTDVLGKYDPQTAAKIVVYDEPASGDIVISEIAWTGSGTDGSDEWIELYNTSKIPLSMDSLLITHAGNEDLDFVFDDSDGLHTINRHLIMPGAYAVIADEDKGHSSINVTPAVVGNNSMYLKNNATVTYELKNKAGKVLDSAFFDGTFGGRYGTANGEVIKTMERNKDFADGTKLTSWHSAYGHRGWDGDPLQTMNWGSPGMPNSDIPECQTDGECVKMFAGLNVPQCKTPKCGSNGNCAIVDRDDGSSCDDGLFCTDKDVCKAGKCTSGPDRDCSDDNTCTLDSCNEALGLCEHRPDPAAIEGPANSESCSDGIDNDCDGKTDADDPQCLLKITAVTPGNGLYTGGTSVKVIGEGLSIVKNLYFGDKKADFTLIDNSSLSAKTPVGAVGDVDVSVSDGKVSANLTAGFRYTGLTDKNLMGNIQSPTTEIDVQADTPTPEITGRIGGPDLPSEPLMVMADVGYGPVGSDPNVDATWHWFTAQYNADCSDCGSNFEFKGTMTISTPGTYLVSYRYSVDGGYNFLYTTLGIGDPFDPSTALKIVVSGN